MRMGVIVGMSMVVPIPMLVIVVVMSILIIMGMCHLHIHRHRIQRPMANAGFGGDAVGETPYLAGGAAQDGDFHAILVIQMHMQGR